MPSPKKLQVCQQITPACVHRGEETGQVIQCGSCRGNVGAKLFMCSLHLTCTPRTPVPGHRLCLSCGDRREA